MMTQWTVPILSLTSDSRQHAQARPGNPLNWMIKFLMERQANLATNDAAVAGGSELHVALSHGVVMTQEYLVEKKVHVVLHELALQVGMIYMTSPPCRSFPLRTWQVHASHAIVMMGDQPGRTCLTA